jgi:hypothetical protein
MTTTLRPFHPLIADQGDPSETTTVYPFGMLWDRDDAEPVPDLEAGTLSRLSHSATSVTMTYSAPTGGVPPYVHELQHHDGEAWQAVREIDVDDADAVGGLEPGVHQFRVVTTDDEIESAASNVLQVDTTDEAPTGGAAILRSTIIQGGL